MNIQGLNECGIDYEEGVDRFANKADLYEKFLLKFPEDNNYSQLLIHIEEKNFEGAFRNAHALKGIAGNLSLKKLYQDISELVEELHLGKYDNLAELVDAVKKSYEESLNAIKSCV